LLVAPRKTEPGEETLHLPRKRKSKEGKKSRRKGSSNSNERRSTGALGLPLAEAEAGTSKTKAKRPSADAFGLKFDRWLIDKKAPDPLLQKTMSNATFPVIVRNDTGYNKSMVNPWLPTHQNSID
jgi:hypothetical protein